MELSVSVIITTHKRHAFLRRALFSVLAQDSPVNEIIIVDDDPLSDLSFHVPEIEIPVVTYIKNKTSMGGNFCRNLGAEHATSDLIMFLDDDDAWCYTKVTKQLAIFKQLKSIDKHLIYSGRKFLEGSSASSLSPLIWRPRLKRFKYKPLEIGSTSSISLSRSSFLESGGFTVSLQAMQDFEFYVKLSKDDFRFIYDNSSNLLYTIHSGTRGQISRETDKIRNAADYILKMHADYFNQFNSVTRRSIVSRIYFSVAKAFAIHGQNRLARDYTYKSLKEFPRLGALYLLGRILFD